MPTDKEQERKFFEQWYLDDVLPSEYSSHYARTVIFKREADGDWYEREDIQAMWRGWMGKAGIDPQE